MAIVFLVAATAVFVDREAQTYATGDPPLIVYGSMTDNSSFAEGPIDPAPTGMYFQFGAFNGTPYLVDVIFDLFVQPSDQHQVFYAYVSDADLAATALADAIGSAGPAGQMMGISASFRQSSGGVHFVIPDSRLSSPAGGNIQYFKLTIPPFSIDAETLTPSFGPPIPGYALHPDGALDIVEAFGPPPPGDVTCDAVANAIDALFVLQHDAGLLDSLPCAKAADANGDGAVDSLDASLILQFAAGLIAVP